MDLIQVKGIVRGWQTEIILSSSGTPELISASLQIAGYLWVWCMFGGAAAIGGELGCMLMVALVRACLVYILSYGGEEVGHISIFHTFLLYSRVHFTKQFTFRLYSFMTYRLWITSNSCYILLTSALTHSTWCIALYYCCYHSDWLQLNPLWLWVQTTPKLVTVGEVVVCCIQF